MLAGNTTATHSVYLGLFFAGCPRFLQQNRQCDSSWTVHLSVHTTSLNAKSVCLLAQSSCFCLLAWRISWQYELPRKVQPNAILQRRIVHREILYPRDSSNWWSWWADVSSSVCICSSTISLTSVIFEGLPDPVRLPIDPVSRYFAINLLIPLLLAARPSAHRRRSTVGLCTPGCGRKWSVDTCTDCT